MAGNEVEIIPLDEGLLDAIQDFRIVAFSQIRGENADHIASFVIEHASEVICLVTELAGGGQNAFPGGRSEVFSQWRIVEDEGDGGPGESEVCG